MYTPVSMKLSWKTAKQSPIYTRNLPVLNEKIKPLWTGTWEEKKKMYWREDLKVNYKIELNKIEIPVLQYFPLRPLGTSLLGMF